MKVILNIYVLALIFLSISCAEKEVMTKDYPYIITEDISGIDKTSVVFNGKVISTGDVKFSEYGFLWDIQKPTIEESANKIIIESPLKTGSFSKTIDYNLYKDKEQYVRAYMKTDNLIVYGNTIKFSCNGGKPIIIDDIIPRSGYVNSKVVITGDNFGVDKNKVHVFFGDTEAEIDSCSNDRIVTKVPDFNYDIECVITVETFNKPKQFSDKFKAFTYWKTITPFPGAKRYGAVSFTINGKGYVGLGTQYWGSEFSDMYEYNPINDSWSKKADFPGDPRAFAVGCTINGKGYVGFGLGGDYYHDLWEYDPVSDSWTKKIEDSRIWTYSDAYFVLNNQIYIFAQGGSFKYIPENNQIIEIDRFPGVYRFFSMGLTCNNLGYIIAGQEPGNTLLKDLWCYKESTNSWMSKTEIPSGYRDGIAAFTLHHKIYAGLGGIWGGEHLDFYEYNPDSDMWIRVQDFPGDKRELPVSFTIEDRAYIGSGRNFRGEELNDFWEFNPNKK